MQFRWRPADKLAPELSGGGRGVALCQEREHIRIRNAEVPFQKIVAPRQTQNGNRQSRERPICMAIEGAMQQHIAGPDNEAAGKSCLFERAREHYGCITASMTVARQKNAGVESLHPELNWPVSRASFVGHAGESTPAAAAGESPDPATRPKSWSGGEVPTEATRRH